MRSFYEKLMDQENAEHLEQMFAELRCLVNSWGNWRKNRPPVLLCAVVLIVYAQALVVRRGRWWNE